MKPTTTHDAVRAYYSHILSSSEDLSTNATSCATQAPPKYVLDVLPCIADEVVERFYGCGSPIPPALEGATVLDLGCGTGRDVFVLSKLVGSAGHVIGVDMTPEQLEIAQRYRDYHAKAFGYDVSNVEFRAGYIEDLAACGIKDNSIDLVVSNCVVNLSPFKDLVLSEVFRVLKLGGELYFSDVYATRRLPQDVRDDPRIHGECLGGATYWEDFKQLMRKAGWSWFVCTTDDPLNAGDLYIQSRVGFTSFRSRTIRAIKCAGLEDTEEYYGQSALYKGGMAEMPRYFDFDQDLRFVKGKPLVVSGNTARMLQASRYGRYFDISQAGAHKGAFHFEEAQTAFEMRRHTRSIDVRMLHDASERIGASTFEDRVSQRELLRAKQTPSTLQVNITHACNLACAHCYLECSPASVLHMETSVMEECLQAFVARGFTRLDITGGSPELHPSFEWFVQQASSVAGQGAILVRTNGTLFEKEEYRHLPRFLSDHGVQISLSLPFYDARGVANQRGMRAFEQAIEGVRRLNACGYGHDQALKLDLVYNVAGPHLPLPQDQIESVYRDALKKDFGIAFDNLLAFNNWPLGRFATDLLDYGMFDDYLALLVDNFNTLAVTRMMCLDQISVDWQGYLYDCEANHALKLPIQLPLQDEIDASVRENVVRAVTAVGYEDDEAVLRAATSAACADEAVLCAATSAACADETALHPATVADLLQGDLPPRMVRTHPACYSCTAGFGSSCGGMLVERGR